MKYNLNRDDLVRLSNDRTLMINLVQNVFDIMYLKKILCFILLVVCVACQTKKTSQYFLEVSDVFIKFPIDEDTKLPQLSIFPFEEAGVEYVSFQNDRKPEIQIYNVRTGKLLKKVIYDVQGEQGIIGGFMGYCIKDFSHIYLPSYYTQTLYVADTLGRINQKITFDKTTDGKKLVPITLASSKQMAISGDSLIIPQTVNPILRNKIMDESPISVLIDTRTHIVKDLPMKYLPLVSEKEFGTAAFMAGVSYSKCFNGRSFIYAFAYSDNVHKVTLDHTEIIAVEAKSQYDNGVKVPRVISDEFQKMIKEQCEYASYGSIIYDKYRRVYYRIFYPNIPLGVERDYLELLRTGRKQFSIIVLNENLEIMGETLFPEYTFNPNLFMVLEDGLYLSTSHIKNPNYSDNELCFQRIDLIKPS